VNVKTDTRVMMPIPLIHIYNYLYGEIESIMEITVPMRRGLRLNILGYILMHLLKEIIHKYRKNLKAILVRYWNST